MVMGRMSMIIQLSKISIAFFLQSLHTVFKTQNNAMPQNLIVNHKPKLHETSIIFCTLCGIFVSILAAARPRCRNDGICKKLNYYLVLLIKIGLMCACLIFISQRNRTRIFCNSIKFCRLTSRLKNPFFSCSTCIKTLKSL